MAPATIRSAELVPAVILFPCKEFAAIRSALIVPAVIWFAFNDPV